MLGELIPLVHISTCKLPIIYPDTETDRKKEREKRGSRDVPIYVQLVTT